MRFSYLLHVKLLKLIEKMIAKYMQLLTFYLIALHFKVIGNQRK